MQSIRDRQKKEVLDEDLNLGRRVFAMTEKQVKAFDESVLPKGNKDIQSEIAVDKLLEALQRLLESKTIALETLLSRAGKQKDIKGEFRDAYNRVVINGDVVSLFNQVISVLNSNLARTSYDSIKVKLQDLKPNIDAIDYGLGQLIQSFFAAGVVEEKQIARLTQAQAVYRLIRNQLNTTQYRLINPSEIDVGVREVLSELSEFQRSTLLEFQNSPVAEDKSLLNLPITLDQNRQRIQALESELGFTLPVRLKEKLDRLQPSDEKEAFENIKELQLAKGTSLASLENDYNVTRQQYDDEANELERSIPLLKKRLKKMRQVYSKRSEYAFSILENEKDGEYSTDARGELDEVNELGNELYNLETLLEDKEARQQMIEMDKENLRIQYEKTKEEMQMKELPFKVPKRFAKKPKPDITSPPPRGRSRSKSRGDDEKYDLEGEGMQGMYYDDERNDIYKIRSK